MTIKEIASAAGLSLRQLSKEIGIPLRTVEDWSAGKRNPPDYILNLIQSRIIDGCASVDAAVESKIERAMRSGSRLISRWRSGINGCIEDYPDLQMLVYEGIPCTLCGSDGSPSEAEAAIFAAMTAWAFAQSKASEPMHVRGISLGAAIARAICAESDDNGVEAFLENAARRRLVTIMDTADWRVRADQLKWLAAKIGSAGAPMDFALLAEQLLASVRDPAAASDIAMAWGMDFTDILNASIVKD